MNKQAEGIKSLDKALSIDNNNILALHSKILFYKNTGDTGNYEKSLNAAISASPKTAMDYSNLGIILYMADMPQESYKAFRKSLDMNPLKAKAWLDRANLLSMNRCYDLAIKDYSECISLHPSFIGNCYFFRSVAYYMCGYADSALSDARTALSFLPQDTSCIVLMEALSYTAANMDTGNVTDIQTMQIQASGLFSHQAYLFAEPFYRRLLNKNPNDSILRYNYMYCITESGQFLKAMKYAEGNPGTDSLLIIKARKYADFRLSISHR